jgi:hypothetical protein
MWDAVYQLTELELLILVTLVYAGGLFTGILTVRLSK